MTKSNFGKEATVTMPQLSVLKTWSYCYHDNLSLEAEIVFNCNPDIEMKQGNHGNVTVGKKVQLVQSSLLKKDGNVGIGTTGPNFLLDVAGKANETAIITNDASGAITTCTVGEIRGNVTANKICLCTTANNWKCATVS